MNSGSSSFSNSEMTHDDIDLRDLASVIWRGKLLVVILSFLAVIAGFFYAKTIPDQYRATAILAPASSSGPSSLSNIAGQLGGFASLAGVNLGSASAGNEVNMSIELMKTWGFLETFIISNGLEKEVSAVKSWDKEKNKLIYDANVYAQNEGEWVKGNAPTSWKMYKDIQDRIDVSYDQVSGLVSVNIDHYSPYVAKKWVELLIKEINQFMQMRDRKEAKESIAYLTQQIEKTNIAEMRTIFYQLIEEQTKTLMLAEINSEYIFKILSPPKLPEVKVKPNKIMIVILAGVFGVLTGLIVLVFRYLFKESDTSKVVH